LALVGSKQLGGVVSGFEVIREGGAFAVGLRLANGLELFAALVNQLVVVLGGWGSLGGNLFRHEARRGGSARGIGWGKKLPKTLILSGLRSVPAFL
jgi:hypothetical protein